MSNHERDDPRAGTGDEALGRAWRQASDEQPPAQLDAAILASARKAIPDQDVVVKAIHTSRRSRTWLTGWQPLAAAAGVTGLAFILVQSLPRDRDVVPAIQVEESVSGSIRAPADSPSPSAREAKDEKAAAAAAPTSAEESAVAPDDEHRTRTVPPPPPAAPRESAAQAASPARALDRDSSTGGTAPMRAAEVDQRQTTVPEPSSQAVSEAAAAPAGVRHDVAPLSARDRAARVVALYSSGDVAAAAEALRDFRGADPDADRYLPDSLRNWAKTVE
jgi:hypothetical protein